MVTYFKGGIFLLSAGLIPFSNAFLECIIKCLVGDWDETICMKLPGKQKEKRS